MHVTADTVPPLRYVATTPRATGCTRQKGAAFQAVKWASLSLPRATRCPGLSRWSLPGSLPSALHVASGGNIYPTSALHVPTGGNIYPTSALHVATDGNIYPTSALHVETISNETVTVCSGTLHLL